MNDLEMKYPTYIEIPEGYWVATHDVEYEITG